MKTIITITILLTSLNLFANIEFNQSTALIDANDIVDFQTSLGRYVTPDALRSGQEKVPSIDYSNGLIEINYAEASNYLYDVQLHNGQILSIRKFLELLGGDMGGGGKK